MFKCSLKIAAFCVVQTFLSNSISSVDDVKILETRGKKNVIVISFRFILKDSSLWIACQTSCMGRTGNAWMQILQG